MLLLLRLLKNYVSVIWALSNLIKAENNLVTKPEIVVIWKMEVNNSQQ